MGNKYSDNFWNTFGRQVSVDSEIKNLIKNSGVVMVRDLERLLLPEYPDSENELWGSVLSSVVECANHKGERVIFENENSYELKMIGNANKSVSMIDKSNGNMWILDWTNNVFQFVKKEMPTTR